MTAPANHLARLVAQSQSQASEREAVSPLEEVRRRAEASPAPRGFAAALLAGSGLIAEVKRASPSKGAINPGLDSGALAAAYERGGAACVSVLTEHESFGGSLGDLTAARSACALPLLRKDFLVSRYQIYEARAHGADAVLLIAGAAELPLLRDLRALARELSLSVLFEIHAAEEIALARACEPDLLGINARDLRTLKVHKGAFERIAPLAAGIAPLVAESGVRTPDDVRRYRSLGARALLVGEALSSAADPEAATRALARASEAP